MPSECDVYFIAYVKLGTTPISIPPYIMDPIVLKEIKDQLHKLLEKDFIWHSVSPWDIPLYVCV